MTRCRLRFFLVAALTTTGLASAVHADDTPVRACW